MRQSTGQISRIGTFKSLLQRFAFLSLVILTFALMLVGKADTVFVEQARVAVTDAVAPVLRIMSEPAAAVSSVVGNIRELAGIRDKNAELREANERLLQWQSVAQKLESENKSLRSLLALVPDSAESFVTGRVVADTGGAFALSIIVLAGHTDGVQKGQTVVSGNGLVGRVMLAGKNSSRILLISDINSRIPVYVGNSEQRAILAGDNSGRPRLIFLSNTTGVVPGDKVVTSGAAKAFPPGLPIGQVVKVEDSVIEVEPYAAQDKLQYVRIVDYGLSGILNPSALNGK
ncbi:MAG TPA: rod shape-determining protein MreC [Rhodospirillaceae bacterium]|nr:rod shape-determining protein MreC [Candidatus Neomarinimicrobiota bacterium]HCX14055.1 rod shape-determining protein MreC [Rhodospirillaceae bacterium]